MTDHYTEAIKAAAEAIHEAGWTCEAHEPLGLEKCGQCETSTTELARKTLTAAVPHIRSMIAADTDEPDTDELDTDEPDTGYLNAAVWIAGLT